MTEQELVKTCLTEICKKNGFADPSTMAQRDIELISREIEENTGILISVSTIKRLLNGSFIRTPQIATLNAISTYLGYKNWQEYKISFKDVAGTAQGSGEWGVVSYAGKTDKLEKAGEDLRRQGGKAERSGEPGKKPEKKEEGSQGKESRGRLLRRWSALLLAGIGATLLLKNYSSFFKQAGHYDKAQFSVQRTTANAIPNTVIFHYNIDEVNADSFFIQQSWDRNRRIRIYKKAYTITDIYYEPGYHTAKLIANDSIIKAFPVSIPTNGWFFVAKDIDPKSLPETIKPGNPFKNGHLALDKADLDSNGIRTDAEKIFVYTWFPGTLSISSDNYIFKARVREKDVRNNYCPYITCEIFCQQNFMFFTHILPGCVNRAELQFGEHFVSGRQADLSAFGVDVHQWMEIEVRVKNRQVSILLNNRQIYTGAYKNPSGFLTGLGFISNGLCEVDSVSLMGLDGKVFYKNPAGSHPTGF